MARAQPDWRKLPRKPWPDRFWEKVDKRGPIMPGMTTRCWPWTGSRVGGKYDRHKYGALHHKGKVLKAHRVAYEEQIGPIPKGHEVCHRCDYPPCQRGDHLFAATHQGNMTDMKEKGRATNARREDLRG